MTIVILALRYTSILHSAYALSQRTSRCRPGGETVTVSRHGRRWTRTDGAETLCRRVPPGGKDNGPAIGGRHEALCPDVSPGGVGNERKKFTPPSQIERSGDVNCCGVCA